MKLKNTVLVLSLIASLDAAAQNYQRNSLIEDFSNEECHPCHNMAVNFHPAILSLSVNDTASHVNVISYQMDFPGTDPSYNLHVQQRADFYNIGSLPFARLNGNRGVSQQMTQQQYHDFFDTSRNTTSSIKLSGSYMFNTTTKQITASVTAASSSALNGPYKIYTALAERHYHSTSSSIGMDDYYFVMRQMLPDGNGRAETVWTANIPKQFQYTTTYQTTNPPAVGSFDFWGNPLMSDMILFVQDTITKEVLQSQVIKPTFPTSVATHQYINGFLVYPNPANHQLSIAFDLNENCDIALKMIDATGKNVYQRQADKLPMGRTQITIPTYQLPSGMYWIEVAINDKKIIKQITLSH